MPSDPRLSLGDALTRKGCRQRFTVSAKAPLFLRNTPSFQSDNLDLKAA